MFYVCLLSSLPVNLCPGRSNQLWYLVPEMGRDHADMLAQYPSSPIYQEHALFMCWGSRFVTYKRPCVWQGDSQKSCCLQKYENEGLLDKLC